MSKNHAEFMGAQLEIIYYYAKSFQNSKLAKTMQNSWGTTRNNILLCKIVPKSKISKNHAEFMGAQLEIIYYYAKSFQNPKLAKTMQNSWGHNSK